jgi:putative methyltransferase (TIGR04325 family)
MSKTFVKNLLPPIIFSQLSRHFNKRKKIRFEGPFPSWDIAAMQCTGYDSEEILDKVLSSSLKVKQGSAVFERDSVLFDEIQYSWPLAAALLLAAVKSEGQLSVLDFGGSLGSSYFQNRKIISSLKKIQWSVVEQEHYVVAGMLKIADESLKFYKSIKDCVKDNKPNAVLLSSVLQYLPTPYELIEEIISLRADIVVIDRTPILLSGERDVINMQITPKVICQGSYPIRFFVKSNLVKAFEIGGYELFESFKAIDNLDTSASWMGFIFKRKN